MCAGALSLVSGAISAVSQLQQGKAQAQLLKHQAAVQRRNAEIARNRGAREATKERRANERAQGEFIASSATRGFSLGGSNDAALTDLITEGELRRAAIIHDAEADRINKLDQANQSEARASIAKSRASAGFASSIVGLLGKAGQSFGSNSSLRGFF